MTPEQREAYDKGFEAGVESERERAARIAEMFAEEHDARVADERQKMSPNPQCLLVLCRQSQTAVEIARAIRSTAPEKG